MNRSDLQKLARMRIKEAKVLLDGGCFEGAYYLAGYAVECALKACIAKRTRRYDFPDKKVANDVYCHELTRLLGFAGLAPEMNREENANSAVWVNWGVVKDWSETKRYEASVSANDARDLYAAIAGRRNGVLQWLRNWW